jgi:flagellar biosynthesis component FlhA
LRLATSLAGQPWDNAALVDELRGASEVPQGGHWSVWNWQDSEPAPALLEVLVAVPEDAGSAAATHDFLDRVGNQLRHTFALYSAERGWPQPSFRLRRTRSGDGRWTYQASLPGGPSAQGVLKPTKLLAMGDEKQLAPLLGLETVDPVLGLPAKWIGRSQLGQGQSAELHLFESPGLVAAHCLHMIGELWHRCFGFLEVQRWLLGCAATHAELLSAVIVEHTGLFLRTLKALVADHLWLPHPSRFLELFLSALAELDTEDAVDPALLVELLRKDVVPLNLGRFCDSRALLQAVEWKSESEGDDADQSRLLLRLSQALSQVEGDGACPVVVTDFESRALLSGILHGPFPDLPVLSWAELPAHVRVEIVAVVDARLELDPSPWPYATYGVDPPEECTGRNARNW